MNVRVSDWFSFSHWGLFLLPLLTCPDWLAMGMDLDDEQISEVEGQTR